jgi:hypothetical protein
MFDMSKQKKWNEEDKWAFAHSRLRAQTIPDKRKEKAKSLCRKKVKQSDV